jgi:hypothetical protein
MNLTKNPFIKAGDLTFGKFNRWQVTRMLVL